MDFIEKINKLPTNVREYICSNDVRLTLERACFLYGVSEDQIGKMALPVRDIFTRDSSLSQLPDVIGEKLLVRRDISCGIAYELNNKMFSQFNEYFTDAHVLLAQWRVEKKPPIVSEEEVNRLILQIEPWILENDNNVADESKGKKKRETIDINAAIKKYPSIKEQLITSIPLVLRISPDPVRPTVNNWITDYHEQMGLGKHSSFERGNYLFHSENTKRLAAEDRQKVSVILASLDEGTPLSVDPEKQEVIFREEPKISNQQTKTNIRPSMSGMQSVASNRPNIVSVPQQATRIVSAGIDEMRRPVLTMPQSQASVTHRPQMPMENRQFTKTSQPPQNLPHETEEKIANYYNPQLNVQQREMQYPQNVQSAQLKREFGNKSPNFSQLLKSQSNDKSVRRQPSNNASTNSSAGTVSFSSPQQLPVERKAAIPGRSPYRISPHDEE